MNTLRISFAILAALLGVQPVSAALKEAKVKGTYTYYDDGTKSRAECERLALEGARLEAIAREFGTVVSQNVVQHDLVDNAGESTYFSALSSTEVKGEWIADEGKPEYKVSLDADGYLVVECTITGRAREISNESVDFEALVLRNGSERRFVDTHFRNGDDLRVLLKSPVDGYVAIYIVDEGRQVSQLLPYASGGSGEVMVKRGRDYVFFDNQLKDPSHGQVDELMLTTDMAKEHNKVYVIMSPNRFALPVSSLRSDEPLYAMTFEVFNRWLAKTRRADSRMGVKVINIDITDKESL